MRKLGADIPRVLAQMGANTPEARINMRAHQVRARYKEALETVYRETAPLFLAHTNNVYIMKKQGVVTLIVYVDESIFAAELNAQRELIKLKLLELFGEEIEEFEIHVSRGNYKKNHPYLKQDSNESEEKAPSVPLDDQEKLFVSQTVSTIEAHQLRKAVEKAMTADMEWKKGERVKNSGKNKNGAS